MTVRTDRPLGVASPTLSVAPPVALTTPNPAEILPAPEPAIDVLHPSDAVPVWARGASLIIDRAKALVQSSFAGVGLSKTPGVARAERVSLAATAELSGDVRWGLKQLESTLGPEHAVLVEQARAFSETGEAGPELAAAFAAAPEGRWYDPKVRAAYYALQLRADALCAAAGDVELAVLAESDPAKLAQAKAQLQRLRDEAALYEAQDGPLKEAAVERERAAQEAAMRRYEGQLAAEADPAARATLEKKRARAEANFEALSRTLGGRAEAKIRWAEERGRGLPPDHQHRALAGAVWSDLGALSKARALKELGDESAMPSGLARAEPPDLLRPPPEGASADSLYARAALLHPAAQDEYEGERIKLGRLRVGLLSDESAIAAELGFTKQLAQPMTERLLNAATKAPLSAEQSATLATAQSAVNDADAHQLMVLTEAVEAQAQPEIVAARVDTRKLQVAAARSAVVAAEQNLFVVKLGLAMGGSSGPEGMCSIPADMLAESGLKQARQALEEASSALSNDEDALLLAQAGALERVPNVQLLTQRDASIERNKSVRAALLPGALPRQLDAALYASQGRVLGAYGHAEVARAQGLLQAELGRAQAIDLELRLRPLEEAPVWDVAASIKHKAERSEAIVANEAKLLDRVAALDEHFRSAAALAGQALAAQNAAADVVQVGHAAISLELSDPSLSAEDRARLLEERATLDGARLTLAVDLVSTTSVAAAAGSGELAEAAYTLGLAQSDALGESAAADDDAANASVARELAETYVLVGSQLSHQLLFGASYLLVSDDPTARGAAAVHMAELAEARSKSASPSETTAGAAQPADAKAMRDELFSALDSWKKSAERLDRVAHDDMRHLRNAAYEASGALAQKAQDETPLWSDAGEWVVGLFGATTLEDRLTSEAQRVLANGLRSVVSDFDAVSADLVAADAQLAAESSEALGSSLSLFFSPRTTTEGFEQRGMAALGRTRARLNPGPLVDPLSGVRKLRGAHAWDVAQGYALLERSFGMASRSIERTTDNSGYKLANHSVDFAVSFIMTSGVGRALATVVKASPRLLALTNSVSRFRSGLSLAGQRAFVFADCMLRSQLLAPVLTSAMSKTLAFVGLDPRSNLSQLLVKIAGASASAGLSPMAQTSGAALLETAEETFFAVLPHILALTGLSAGNADFASNFLEATFAAIRVPRGGVAQRRAHAEALVKLETKLSLLPTDASGAEQRAQIAHEFFESYRGALEREGYDATQAQSAAAALRRDVVASAMREAEAKAAVADETLTTPSVALEMDDVHQLDANAQLAVGAESSPVALSVAIDARVEQLPSLLALTDGSPVERAFVEKWLSVETPYHRALGVTLDGVLRLRAGLPGELAAQLDVELLDHILAATITAALPAAPSAPLLSPALAVDAATVLAKWPDAIAFRARLEAASSPLHRAALLKQVAMDSARLLSSDPSAQAAALADLDLIDQALGRASDWQRFELTTLAGVKAERLPSGEVIHTGGAIQHSSNDCAAAVNIQVHATPADVIRYRRDPALLAARSDEVLLARGGKFTPKRNDRAVDERREIEDGRRMLRSIVRAVSEAYRAALGDPDASIDAAKREQIQQELSAMLRTLGRWSGRRSGHDLNGAKMQDDVALCTVYAVARKSLAELASVESFDEFCAHLSALSLRFVSPALAHFDPIEGTKSTSYRPPEGYVYQKVDRTGPAGDAALLAQIVEAAELVGPVPISVELSGMAVGHAMLILPGIVYDDQGTPCLRLANSTSVRQYGVDDGSDYSGETVLVPATQLFSPEATAPFFRGKGRHFTITEVFLPQREGARVAEAPSGAELAAELTEDATASDAVNDGVNGAASFSSLAPEAEALGENGLDLEGLRQRARTALPPDLLPFLAINNDELVVAAGKHTFDATSSDNLLAALHRSSPVFEALPRLEQLPKWRGEGARAVFFQTYVRGALALLRDIVCVTAEIGAVEDSHFGARAARRGVPDASWQEIAAHPAFEANPNAALWEIAAAAALAAEAKASSLPAPRKEIEAALKRLGFPHDHAERETVITRALALVPEWRGARTAIATDLGGLMRSREVTLMARALAEAYGPSSPNIDIILHEEFSRAMLSDVDVIFFGLTGREGEYPDSVTSQELSYLLKNPPPFVVLYRIDERDAADVHAEMRATLAALFGEVELADFWLDRFENGNQHERELMEKLRTLAMRAPKNVSTFLTGYLMASSEQKRQVAAYFASGRASPGALLRGLEEVDSALRGIDSGVGLFSARHERLPLSLIVPLAHATIAKDARSKPSLSLEQLALGLETIARLQRENPAVHEQLLARLNEASSDLQRVLLFRSIAHNAGVLLARGPVGSSAEADALRSAWLRELSAVAAQWQSLDDAALTDLVEAAPQQWFQLSCVPVALLGLIAAADPVQAFLLNTVPARTLELEQQLMNEGGATSRVRSDRTRASERSAFALVDDVNARIDDALRALFVPHAAVEAWRGRASGVRDKSTYRQDAALRASFDAIAASVDARAKLPEIFPGGRVGADTFRRFAYFVCHGAGRLAGTSTDSLAESSLLGGLALAASVACITTDSRPMLSDARVSEMSDELRAGRPVLLTLRNVGEDGERLADHQVVLTAWRRGRGGEEVRVVDGLTGEYWIPLSGLTGTEVIPGTRTVVAAFNLTKVRTIDDAVRQANEVYAVAGKRSAFGTDETDVFGTLIRLGLDPNGFAPQVSDVALAKQSRSWLGGFSFNRLRSWVIRLRGTASLVEAFKAVDRLLGPTHRSLAIAYLRRCFSALRGARSEQDRVAMQIMLELENHSRGPVSGAGGWALTWLFGSRVEKLSKLLGSRSTLAELEAYLQAPANQVFADALLSSKLSIESRQAALAQELAAPGTAHAAFAWLSVNPKAEAFVREALVRGVSFVRAVDECRSMGSTGIAAKNAAEVFGSLCFLSTLTPRAGVDAERFVALRSYLDSDPVWAEFASAFSGLERAHPSLRAQISRYLSGDHDADARLLMLTLNACQILGEQTVISLLTRGASFDLRAEVASGTVTRAARAELAASVQELERYIDASLRVGVEPSPEQLATIGLALQAMQRHYATLGVRAEVVLRDGAPVLLVQGADPTHASPPSLALLAETQHAKFAERNLSFSLVFDPLGLWKKNAHGAFSAATGALSIDFMSASTLESSDALAHELLHASYHLRRARGELDPYHPLSQVLALARATDVAELPVKGYERAVFVEELATQLQDSARVSRGEAADRAIALLRFGFCLLSESESTAASQSAKASLLAMVARTQATLGYAKTSGALGNTAAQLGDFWLKQLEHIAAALSSPPTGVQVAAGVVRIMFGSVEVGVHADGGVFVRLSSGLLINLQVHAPALRKLADAVLNAPTHAVRPAAAALLARLRDGWILEASAFISAQMRALDAWNKAAIALDLALSKASDPIWLDADVQHALALFVELRALIVDQNAAFHPPVAPQTRPPSVGASAVPKPSGSSKAPPPEAPKPLAAKPSRPFDRPIVARREELVRTCEAFGADRASAERLFALAAIEEFDPILKEFGRGVDRKPTVQRAIEHVGQSGDVAFYVEMDLVNVNGLNQRLGHTDATAVMVEMSEIVAAELRAIGAEVQLFRHGGDEISAVIVSASLDPAVVERALSSAEARIQTEVVAKRGLQDLPHLKYPGKHGTGIIAALSPILAGDTVDAVTRAADARVELEKLRGVVPVPASVPAPSPPSVVLLPPVMEESAAAPQRFNPPVIKRRRDLIAAAVAMGIGEADARQLAERLRPFDQVTGFAPADAHHSTIDAAIAHLRLSPGDAAFYIEIDVRNLGGLNAALGHTGADAAFWSMAKIVEARLAKLGVDVVMIRHGGDEFSAVVVGDGSLDAAAVERALADARAEITQWVKDAELHELPHAKHRSDTNLRGTGLSFGVSRIAALDSVNNVTRSADVRLELDKLTRD